MKLIREKIYSCLQLIKKIGDLFRIVIPLNGLSVDFEDVKLAKFLLKEKQNEHSDKHYVKLYEKQFASINQSRFAYSFLKGRVALSACIYALGLEKGDTVILPAYTCIVVANACWYEGIECSFCDIELDTFGLDAKELEKNIKNNPNAKAIILQHTYGLVCRDYQKILQIAESRGIKVIEDCTHAFGALFHGEPVGNRGHLAFFSSEYSKVFSTFCGGMAVTNDVILAERLAAFQCETPFPDQRMENRLLKNLILRYYWKLFYQVPLFYRLFAPKLPSYYMVTTTQAEIDSQEPDDYRLRFPTKLARLGLYQLDKIELMKEKRERRSQYWCEWCLKNGWSPPLIISNSHPIFLRYPVLVTEEMKKNTFWARKLGVEIGVWFVSYLHPSDKDIGYFPNAEKAVKCCVNFPTLW